MKNIINIVVLTVAVGFLAACGSQEEKGYIDRMSKEHQGDAPVQNAASDLESQVSGEEVIYATVAGIEVSGYLAKPEDAWQKTVSFFEEHLKN